MMRRKCDSGDVVVVWEKWTFRDRRWSYEVHSPEGELVARARNPFLTAEAAMVAGVKRATRHSTMTLTCYHK